MELKNQLPEKGKKKTIIISLLALLLLSGVLFVAKDYFFKTKTSEDYTQKIYAAVSPEELATLAKHPTHPSELAESASQQLAEEKNLVGEGLPDKSLDGVRASQTFEGKATPTTSTNIGKTKLDLLEKGKRKPKEDLARDDKVSKPCPSDYTTVFKINQDGTWTQFPKDGSALQGVSKIKVPGNVEKSGNVYVYSDYVNGISEVCTNVKSDLLYPDYEASALKIGTLEQLPSSGFTGSVVSGINKYLSRITGRAVDDDFLKGDISGILHPPEPKGRYIQESMIGKDGKERAPQENDFYKSAYENVNQASNNAKTAEELASHIQNELGKLSNAFDHCDKDLKNHVDDLKRQIQNIFLKQAFDDGIAKSTKSITDFYNEQLGLAAMVVSGQIKNENQLANEKARVSNIARLVNQGKKLDKNDARIANSLIASGNEQKFLFGKNEKGEPTIGLGLSDLARNNPQLAKDIIASVKDLGLIIDGDEDKLEGSDPSINNEEKKKISKLLEKAQQENQKSYYAQLEKESQELNKKAEGFSFDSEANNLFEKINDVAGKLDYKKGFRENIFDFAKEIRNEPEIKDKDKADELLSKISNAFADANNYDDMINDLLTDATKTKNSDARSSLKFFQLSAFYAMAEVYSGLSDAAIIQALEYIVHMIKLKKYGCEIDETKIAWGYPKTSANEKSEDIIRDPGGTKARGEVVARITGKAAMSVEKSMPCLPCMCNGRLVAKMSFEEVSKEPGPTKAREDEEEIKPPVSIPLREKISVEGIAAEYLTEPTQEKSAEKISAGPAPTLEIPTVEAPEKVEQPKAKEVSKETGPTKAVEETEEIITKPIIPYLGALPEVIKKLEEKIKDPCDEVKGAIPGAYNLKIGDQTFSVRGDFAKSAAAKFDPSSVDCVKEIIKTIDEDSKKIAEASGGILKIKVGELAGANNEKVDFDQEGRLKIGTQTVYKQNSDKIIEIMKSEEKQRKDCDKNIKTNSDLSNYVPGVSSARLGFDKDDKPVISFKTSDGQGFVNEKGVPIIQKTVDGKTESFIANKNGELMPIGKPHGQPPKIYLVDKNGDLQEIEAPTLSKEQSDCIKARAVKEQRLQNALNDYNKELNKCKTIGVMAVQKLLGRFTTGDENNIKNALKEEKQSSVLLGAIKLIEQAKGIEISETETSTPLNDAYNNAFRECLDKSDVKKNLDKTLNELEKDLKAKGIEVPKDPKERLNALLSGINKELKNSFIGLYNELEESSKLREVYDYYNDAMSKIGKGSVDDQIKALDKLKSQMEKYLEELDISEEGKDSIRQLLDGVTQNYADLTAQKDAINLYNNAKESLKGKNLEEQSSAMFGLMQDIISMAANPDLSDDARNSILKIYDAASDAYENLEIKLGYNDAKKSLEYMHSQGIPLDEDEKAKYASEVREDINNIIAGKSVTREQIEKDAAILSLLADAQDPLVHPDKKDQPTTELFDSTMRRERTSELYDTMVDVLQSTLSKEQDPAKQLDLQKQISNLKLAKTKNDAHVTRNNAVLDKERILIGGLRTADQLKPDEVAKLRQADEQIGYSSQLINTAEKANSLSGKEKIDFLRTTYEDQMASARKDIVDNGASHEAVDSKSGWLNGNFGGLLPWIVDKVKGKDQTTENANNVQTSLDLSKGGARAAVELIAKEDPNYFEKNIEPDLKERFTSTFMSTNKLDIKSSVASKAIADESNSLTRDLYIAGLKNIGEGKAKQEINNLELGGTKLTEQEKQAINLKHKANAFNKIGSLIDEANNNIDTLEFVNLIGGSAGTREGFNSRKKEVESIGNFRSQLSGMQAQLQGDIISSSVTLREKITSDIAQIDKQYAQTKDEKEKYNLFIKKEKLEYGLKELDKSMPSIVNDVLTSTKDALNARVLDMDMKLNAHYGLDSKGNVVGTGAQRIGRALTKDMNLAETARTLTGLDGAIEDDIRQEQRQLRSAGYGINKILDGKTSKLDNDEKRALEKIGVNIDKQGNVRFDKEFSGKLQDKISRSDSLNDLQYKGLENVGSQITPDFVATTILPLGLAGKAAHAADSAIKGALVTRKANQLGKAISGLEKLKAAELAVDSNNLFKALRFAGEVTAFEATNTLVGAGLKSTIRGEELKELLPQSTGEVVEQFFHGAATLGAFKAGGKSFSQIFGSKTAETGESLLRRNVLVSGEEKAFNKLITQRYGVASPPALNVKNFASAIGVMGSEMTTMIVVGEVEKRMHGEKPELLNSATEAAIFTTAMKMRMPSLGVKLGPRSKTDRLMSDLASSKRSGEIARGELARELKAASESLGIKELRTEEILKLKPEEFNRFGERADSIRNNAARLKNIEASRDLADIKVKQNSLEQSLAGRQLTSDNVAELRSTESKILAKESEIIRRESEILRKQSERLFAEGNNKAANKKLEEATSFSREASIKSKTSQGLEADSLIFKQNIGAKEFEASRREIIDAALSRITEVKDNAREELAQAEKTGNDLLIGNAKAKIAMLEARESALSAEPSRRNLKELSQTAEILDAEISSLRNEIGKTKAENFDTEKVRRLNDLRQERAGIEIELRNSEQQLSKGEQRALAAEQKSREAIIEASRELLNAKQKEINSRFKNKEDAEYQRQKSELDKSDLALRLSAEEIKLQRDVVLLEKALDITELKSLSEKPNIESQKRSEKLKEKIKEQQKNLELVQERLAEIKTENSMSEAAFKEDPVEIAKFDERARAEYESRIKDIDKSEVKTAVETLSRSARERASLGDSSGIKHEKIIDKSSRQDLEARVNNYHERIAKGERISSGEKLSALKVEKRLKLEKIIESLEKKKQETASDNVKEALDLRIKELKAAENVKIETGNKKVDALLEEMVLEYESRINENFGADRLFSVNARQIDAINRFVNTGEMYGLEFPLGGGKTSTVAPLAMEFARVLKGQKGLFIVPKNAGRGAYSESANAFAKMGVKTLLIESTRSVDALEAQLKKAKEADHVYVEADVIGFLQAEAFKQTRHGTMEARRSELARELLEFLGENRKIIVDEAHDLLNPNNRYTIGTDAKIISDIEAKRVEEAAKSVFEIFKSEDIGILKDGKISEESFSRVEGKDAVDYQLKKEVIDKIQEKIGEKAGVSKEKVDEVLKTAKTEKDHNKIAERTGISAESVAKIIEHADGVNKFADFAAKTLFENAKDSGFARIGSKIAVAKSGKAEPSMQLNDLMQAYAQEAVGSYSYDKAPNWEGVKQGGKSTTATLSDFINRALAKGKGSEVTAMTGSFGDNAASMIARGFRLEQSTEVNDKFFGNAEKGIEGIIKENDVIGKSSEAEAVAEISKLREQGEFRESAGQANKNNNLGIAIPKGSSAEVIMKMLAEQSGMQSIERFIISDTQGNFNEYVKVNGKLKINRRGLSQEAVRDIFVKEGVKETVLIFSEGKSTGTNIPISHEVPGVVLTRSKGSENLANLVLQATGRFGRLQNEAPPKIKLIVTDNAAATKQSLVKKLYENEAIVGRKLTSETLSNTLEDMLARVIKNKIMSGEYKDGSKEISSLKEKLLDLQSRGFGEKTIEFEKSPQKTVDSLNAKIKEVGEFAEKLLGDKEFKKLLSTEESLILEGLAKGKEKTIEFSKEQKSQSDIASENIAGSKTLEEFLSKVKRAISENDINSESVGKGADKNIIRAEAAREILTEKKAVLEQELNVLRDRIIESEKAQQERLDRVINGLKDGDKIITPEGIEYTVGTFNNIPVLRYKIGNDFNIEDARSVLLDLATETGVIIDSQSPSVKIDFAKLSEATLNIDKDGVSAESSSVSAADVELMSEVYDKIILTKKINSIPGINDISDNDRNALDLMNKDELSDLNDKILDDKLSNKERLSIIQEVLSKKSAEVARDIEQRDAQIINRRQAVVNELRDELIAEVPQASNIIPFVKPENRMLLEKTMSELRKQPMFMSKLKACA